MSTTDFLKQIRISRLLPRLAQRSTPPGTVHYVGKNRQETVKIQFMAYHDDFFEEKEVTSLDEVMPLKHSPVVTWINVTGVHQPEVIESVGKPFGIHPLVLEDIVNTTQRPKLEEYDGYLFLVIKMTYLVPDSEDIMVEQLSAILGENYLLTFQEQEEDMLEPIRDRIRMAKGRIRHMGSDFLLYAIFDTIVDHYFTVLEHTGDEIERVEEELLKQANQSLLNSIYRLKQDLIYLRKSIWPLREVINSIQHAEHKLITKQVGSFSVTFTTTPSR